MIHSPALQFCAWCNIQEQPYISYDIVTISLTHRCAQFWWRVQPVILHNSPRQWICALTGTTQWCRWVTNLWRLHTGKIM